MVINNAGGGVNREQGREKLRELRTKIMSM